MEQWKEVAKWKRINSCETVEELSAAILEISVTQENGVRTIPGNGKLLSAENQSSKVHSVVHGMLPLNRLTRNYGIRQQALYIKHCST